MAESEQMVKKKDEDVEQSRRTQKTLYRIRPYYDMYYNRDEGRFKYEIHLPGVPKENVSLKILPELFQLRAYREEGDSKAEYTTTKYFRAEIDKESVEASYENGLLKFSVRIKDPLEDAVDIPIE